MIIAIVATVVLLLGIGGVVAALVLTKKTPAKSTPSTPTPSNPVNPTSPLNPAPTNPINPSPVNPTPVAPTTVNQPPIITIPTFISSPAEGFTLKNGDYTLSMDGKNLVVKRNSDTVWSSGAFNDSNPSSAANSATVSGPYKVSLQNDGNLVVYGVNNTYVWAAGGSLQFNAPAPKKAPYKLTLEADGQLTIRDSEGTLVWKNVKPSAKWSSCSSVDQSQQQCRNELYKKFDFCQPCGETRPMNNASTDAVIRANGDAWCRADHGSEWFFTGRVDGVDGRTGLYGYCAKSRNCFCDY